MVLREWTAYSSRGGHAILQGDSEIVEAWFDQAAEYWKQATTREVAWARENFFPSMVL
jgi:hypothetical protein